MHSCIYLKSKRGCHISWLWNLETRVCRGSLLVFLECIRMSTNQIKSDFCLGFLRSHLGLHLYVLVFKVGYESEGIAYHFEHSRSWISQASAYSLLLIPFPFVANDSLLCRFQCHLRLCLLNFILTFIPHISVLPLHLSISSNLISAKHLTILQLQLLSNFYNWFFSCHISEHYNNSGRMQGWYILILAVNSVLWFTRKLSIDLHFYYASPIVILAALSVIYRQSSIPPR